MPNFKLARPRPWAIAILALLITPALAVADTVSYTGTLANAEDSAEITLTLSADSPVALQTFGFGGGVNGAGTTIAPGGFDPFVGLFSGTGDTAVFLNGTSDILTNDTSGCPPAGLVTLGAVPGQCGDVNLTFPDLAAGTYTILLSDAAYLPAAVFEDAPAYLGDGFVDLTGGVFQTCYDANDCNTDTAAWALDVTTSASSTPPPPPAVPEPPSAELLSLAIAFAAARLTRKSKQALS